MFYAYVFYKDPTNNKSNVRRTGAPTANQDAAVRMVQRTKKDGYVIELGNKVPVWHNLRVS